MAANTTPVVANIAKYVFSLLNLDPKDEPGMFLSGCCLAYFFIGLSNGITSILFILFVHYIIGGLPLNKQSVFSYLLALMLLEKSLLLL